MDALGPYVHFAFSWITNNTLLFGVVGVFLTAFFQSGPVKDFLVDLFSPLTPRSQRSIKGIWLTRWKGSVHGSPKDFEQLIILRQFGRRVSGRTIDGEKPMNRISGRISDNTIFTGIWRNVDDDQRYHGGMQLHIPPDRRTMTGRWIGFNSKNAINTGEWTWILSNPKTSADAQKTELDSYAKRNANKIENPEPASG